MVPQSLDVRFADMRQCKQVGSSWRIKRISVQSGRVWSSRGLFAVRKDIFEDVFDLMRTSRGEVLADPRKVAKCDFHLHGKGEKCILA